jgi:hypothetical protein
VLLLPYSGDGRRLPSSVVSLANRTDLLSSFLSLVFSSVCCSQLISAFGIHYPLFQLLREDEGRHSDDSFLNLNSKEPEDSRFGRQDYWNEVYEKQSNNPEDKVLLPAVGNYAMLLNVFDDGFTRITAMDYVPEGISRCREMLGESRICHDYEDQGVDLASGSRCKGSQWCF